MPKAKPTATNRRKYSEQDGDEHLICGASDESWEIALAMARSCVRDVIWDACRDSSGRNQSHQQICASVEAYVRSLIRAEKRRSAGKITYRRQFVDQPLAGVEALKRLSRTQKAYALAKAWTELPAVALDALNDACVELRGQPLRSVMARWPNVGGTFVQLDPMELAQLVPLAITMARGYGNRNPIRDSAIITVLGEFARLRGDWPTAKNASRFIASIQNCYRELLPSYGFGVDSDGTIYRLLNCARDAYSKF